MAKGNISFGPGSTPPRGKLGKPGASSVRQPKAKGISPSSPAWGILHSGGSSPEKLRNKANSTFGIGRNPGNGQGRLSSKAKRQVQ